MPSAYVYEDSSTGWRHINSGDIPSGAGSPLTTKGDLYGFDTGNNRVPVGANGTVLTADSTQALGIKWGTASSGTISDITSTGSSITVGSPTGPTTNVDVANSGVTAATYGDSTHVPQFHVGADGRVTLVSNVAISGSGGAGGLIILYDSGYLGADGNFDTGAGGIASGHFGLSIYGYLRSTGAVANDNINMTLNNDAGANYNVNRIQNSSTTVSGAHADAQTSVLAGNVPGASATASYFGSWTGEMPAYDGTSNFKSGHFTSECVNPAVGGNTVLTFIGWSYASASAISRLALAPATGGAKFKAGSRLIIYGVQ